MKTMHKRSRDVGRRCVVFCARFSDAFIRKGVMKSFGVLVPAMTVQLGTNYTTIGLILSLNAAFTQLACLLMNPLMKRMKTRPIAAVGGLVSGVCILCTAFTRSVFISGCLFITAGFCAAASNLGTAITLQQHFGKRFGAVNSLALIGIAAGSTFLPLMTAEIYQHYGLYGSLLILGGLLLNEFPVGAVLVAPRKQQKRKVFAMNEHLQPANGHATTSCDLQKRFSSTGGDIRNADDEVDSNLIQTDQHKGNNTRDPDTCNNEAGPRDSDNRLSVDRTTGQCCWGCADVLKDQFDFRVFRDERHFTFFMIPFLILSSIANYSWILFVTSYAVSVGVDYYQATFLAAAGASGGIVSCMFQAIVFSKRPLWSPHLMAAFCLCGAITLVTQTLHSTLSSLLICSFVIGGSLYGISTVVDAVVAVIVSPKNFQGAITFTFALEGIGTLIAGPFSGFLFDMTGSFKTVFLVLGGITTLTLAIALLLIFARRNCTAHHDMQEIRKDNAIVVL